MRVKSETITVRRGVNLNEATQRRLTALRQLTEASSDSDVVRNALILYEQLAEKIYSGKNFSFRNKDNQAAEGLALGIKEEATEGNVKRNLILYPSSIKRLETLRSTTDAPSDSALIQEAVRIFDIIAQNALADNLLMMSDRTTGQEWEYYVPISRSRPSHKRSFKLLNHFDI